MPRKKKPSGLHLFKKTVAARKPRRRKNPETAVPVRSATRRSNPPITTDLVQSIVPAVGSYAATRLTGRIMRNFVGGRFPTWQKHFGPLGNVLAFIASWVLSHKWRRLERYHTPIVVGSGIALVQSLVQTYLPGLAHLIDAEPAGQWEGYQLTKPSPSGAVNDFRRRKRVRYVSPGELASEEAQAQVMQEDHAATEGAAEESDEAPEQITDGVSEVSPDNLLADNEELTDLYGGVFAQ